MCQVCQNHVEPGRPIVPGVPSVPDAHDAYISINLACHNKVSDVCDLTGVLAQTRPAINIKVCTRIMYINVFC